jgi:hypothetical protein
VPGGVGGGAGGGGGERDEAAEQERPRHGDPRWRAGGAWLAGREK